MIGLYVHYTPASRYAILEACYTLLLGEKKKRKEKEEKEMKMKILHEMPSRSTY